MTGVVVKVVKGANPEDFSPLALMFRAMFNFVGESAFAVDYPASQSCIGCTGLELVGGDQLAKKNLAGDRLIYKIIDDEEYKHHLFFLTYF